MRLRLGRIAGRAGWGIAAQGASSLTNLGLGVVVARAVTTQEFGVFALAFGAYTIVLNAGNALISEPFLIRYSDVPVEEWRRAVGAATGAALSLGLAAGVIALSVGWIIGGSLGHAFVALAPVLPGLLVQDTLRTLFFAGRKGSLTFMIDVVWLVAVFPLLGAVTASGHGSVFWLVLGWGAVGSATAALGSVLAGTPPRIGGSANWLRTQKDLAPRFLAEFMIMGGAQQVALYAIGIVAGLAAVGGIRGAEMLLGPIYVMIYGIYVMAVPEAVSLVERSPVAMRRNLIVLAAGLGAVSVAAGTALPHFPSSLGRALLGASWPETQRALVPIALFMAATGASVAALIGLRALAATKRSLRGRILNAITLIAGGTAGAALGGGARSAAYGVAGGMWVGVVIWWWQLELALREGIVSRSSDLVVESVLLEPTPDIARNAEDLL